ncbi:MAG: 16S rRNA (uracil1498-N3)-methyltransferase [Motiliproteus sp.]|jgi:16S rRNA (uracil1498-N3)-methyltransferase
MRLTRVYEPQPLIEGAELSLNDSAVQHLGRALRMRPGDSVLLFDGAGNEHRAELLALSKREVSVRVGPASARSLESSLAIELGQVMSRGERMDYAVQKATELGVTRIQPLFSERCEVKLSSERQDKRVQHWQQVAISACEQSGRSRVPEILPPLSLALWLARAAGELKLVLHPNAATPLSQRQPPASVDLLIGPEGGLSDQEIAQARDAGFESLQLGPRVLRTETAPVAALSVLQYLWGDLS